VQDLAEDAGPRTTRLYDIPRKVTRHIIGRISN
jgi:hypothetical protein